MFRIILGNVAFGYGKNTKFEARNPKQYKNQKLKIINKSRIVIPAKAEIQSEMNLFWARYRYIDIVLIRLDKYFALLFSNEFLYL